MASDGKTPKDKRDLIAEFIAEAYSVSGTRANGGHYLLADALIHLLNDRWAIVPREAKSIVIGQDKELFPMVQRWIEIDGERIHLGTPEMTGPVWTVDKGGQDAT